MAEQEQTGQAATINTQQPTPLRGLVIRGHHKVETVTCVRDGQEIVVNKADYDPKEHGEIAKLPTRKKTARKKKEGDDDGGDE